MRCRAASTVGTPSTRRLLPDGKRALRRPTQVLGQDMQVLRIHLNRGDKALAEPGAMVYMSENVEAGCDSDTWWPGCMGCGATWAAGTVMTEDSAMTTAGVSP